jgi:FAD/FMN-containing dehydrogenase/Fe-S oxidoreductase
MAEFPSETTRALAADLAQRLDGEVRFDAGSRALYATDASNYRQVPIGVVIPRSVEDVLATLDACRRHGAPVLARGGGTSLAGQCCNVAVVMDFSKYLNGILEIDAQRRLARVQPGCVLDVLRDAAEHHHLTFGPDPATHDHNTLGGMLGNNSCGVHSVMAGRTADNVRSLDIVTYDGLRLTVGRTGDAELAGIIAAGGRRGEIYRRMKALADQHADEIRQRFPSIPRRVSGFALDQLLPENGFDVARALVGSEGTCVTVLEAELELVPSPPARAMLVLGYPDVYSAADQICQVREQGVIGLEGFDDLLVEYMALKGLHPEDARLLPRGGGWLVAEFGGDTLPEAEAKARAAMAALPEPAKVLYTDARSQAWIWQLRETALAATANVPGHPPAFEGWEDSAVPPARLGAYLREFRGLMERFGYEGSLYGHFGDGCLHVRIDFDFQSPEGIAAFRAFTSDAADLVVKYGGSLSGEHGDGQARADLLDRMYGPRLVDAFRDFKAIWDPSGNMNPGKVVDPWPRDSNLRLGPDFKPPAMETTLAFSADRSSFVRASMRCVGVGTCRRLDGDGVMCPSFMVTREEKHSTRGRARMLFEMIHGGPITAGWKSDEVRDALDLCLSCKGCKHDCPVNVDMAAYKAEFLHHYYDGRLRPREAYAMGLIPYWARVAALAPGLVNRALAAPGLSQAAKWAGGVASRRSFPQFARQGFAKRFRRRGSGGTGPRVLLFPDTFTEAFHPDIAWAAVAVLEKAGYSVGIPRKRLCCGRPLFAWGWLDLARRWLGEVLDELEADIRAGTPLIGLEPACIATFTDELPELFPDDARARGLAGQARLLGDFLAGQPDWKAPRLALSALVHPHCYQHSVLGVEGTASLLSGMGVDYRMLKAGCCGMAGSFGFERAHYDVAMKCGERVLLPEVRAAPLGTLIIADGFSCREQIRQGTGREAMHLAEVLKLASGAQA